MSENEAPFENFFDSAAGTTVTNTPRAGETDKQTKARTREARDATPKKSRKKRTQRQQPAAQAAPESPATSPTKKPRKPRSDKPAADGKTRGVKIDLAVALTAMAGLTSDDAKIVSHIAAGLQKVVKKSRGRIIAALGKIFA